MALNFGNGAVPQKNGGMTNKQENYFLWPNSCLLLMKLGDNCI